MSDDPCATAARVCTEGDFYGDDPDEVFALLSCDLERGHDGLHRDLARGIEWGANPYRSRRALTGTLRLPRCTPAERTGRCVTLESAGHSAAHDTPKNPEPAVTHGDSMLT